MHGRRLQAIKPMVPLAKNTALGIAIMSYAGAIDFGLVSDLDSLPDIERVGLHLRQAIERLADAAGVSVEHGRGAGHLHAGLRARRLSEHRRRRPAARAAH